MIKGISPEGYFKMSVVKTTDVVQSAKERHNLSPINTLLLGRTLTASLLLASELKGEERIRLRLEGDGPVGMVLAEANRTGEVRGYVQHPLANIDYGKDEIGAGLGAGTLSVSKMLYNEAEPRISTIELYHGDISTDVAHYLTQSEQIHSALLLHQTFKPDADVRQAGGLLLQRLPDAPEDVTDQLHERMLHFDSIATLLDEGVYIDEIMERAAHPYQVKELARQPVHFFCRCSRDRFVTALSMLNYRELDEMKGERQEMVCHFCNESYTILPDEIGKLAENAQARMN